MKAYRYLTGTDDAAFCHKVTEALNQGWQLYGDPAITYDEKREIVVCGQAVTKDSDEKSYDPEMKLSEI